MRWQAVKRPLSPIAGTTRDVLREHIHRRDAALHILDTAGLRDAQRQLSVSASETRWQEGEQADRVLFMIG